MARAPHHDHHDDGPDEGPSAEDVERFSDATRICPECNKQVFDDVAICYHCGHAFSSEPKGTPVWVMIVAVVLLLAFFGWLIFR